MKGSNGETIGVGARKIDKTIGDVEMRSRDVDPQSGGVKFQTSRNVDEFRRNNSVNLPRIADKNNGKDPLIGRGSVYVGPQSNGTDDDDDGNRPAEGRSKGGGWKSQG